MDRHRGDGHQLYVDAQTRTRLRASALLDYTTQRDAHLVEMKIKLKDTERKRAKNLEKKAKLTLELLTKHDPTNVLTADSRVQRLADKLIEACRKCIIDNANGVDNVDNRLDL